MENIYENESFFYQYSKMQRSEQGLSGAGEWYQLKKLLPPLREKTLLDLGCGYGWHCKYAIEQGAKKVLGIDQSKKMIDEARKRNSDANILYQVGSLEEYKYPKEEWDIVISNLVLHYIEDLKKIYQKVYQTLKPEGVFVFNIEHPVFTGGVGQDWIYDSEGHPLYWPVDNYYTEGVRETNFLGCKVEKYHHTLTSIVMGLLQTGFTIEALEEAKPDEHAANFSEMADELRRPMMLLIKVKK